MTLADRKTPETDIGSDFNACMHRDYCRQLKRERDAALEALELICKTYGQWVGEPGPSLTDTVESARATLRAIEESKS